MRWQLRPWDAPHLIHCATQHRSHILYEEDILIRKPGRILLAKRGISLKEPISEIG